MATPGCAVPAMTDKPEPDNDARPGVPGFRTWRGVYWFVLGSFVVVVALLAWFTQAFPG